MYFTFEYAPATLFGVLRANNLTEPYVQFIGYQIIRGLNYLHSRGIVHRDLKPENIVMYKDLTIRLIDFGLARNMHPEDLRHTMTVATFAYRAPEICCGIDYGAK